MSALHVYVLKCNGEGCKDEFTVHNTRADFTRQQAREQKGWLWQWVQRGRGPGKSLDYCAIHAHLGEASGKPLPEHMVEVESSIIEEIIRLSEPYTREQFDAKRTRVLARLCDKHGITEAEIEPLIREHRYTHSEEDIEEEYIELAAIARTCGWPL